MIYLLRPLLLSVFGLVAAMAGADLHADLGHTLGLGLVRSLRFQL